MADKPTSTEATPAPAFVPERESATLTKIQKLAALLIILGPDTAAQILKNLDGQELEAISTEMAKTAWISPELRADILGEFSDLAVGATGGQRGGVEYTQSALEQAVGTVKASAIVNRVAPSRPVVPAMKQIVESDARQTFSLLKEEQPQTIALLVSYFPPEKASEVLALMKPELRDQVVERLATLEPAPIEAVEKVVAMLNERTKGKPPQALHQTGGLKSAASLLNALDKGTSKTILASLEIRNPKLVVAIQQKMFTFEDLALIDGTALQRVMREVDLRELAVALKAASPTVKNALLGCISKRAAATVNEEISFMGALKQRDLEAAQNKIVEIVRRLEAEGEIELGESGEKQNAAA